MESETTEELFRFFRYRVIIQLRRIIQAVRPGKRHVIKDTPRALRAFLLTQNHS